MPKFSIQNLNNFVESQRNKTQKKIQPNLENPLERLQNWVSEREQSGTIDFTRFKTAEFGTSLLRSGLNKFFRSWFKSSAGRVKKQLTKEYYNYCKEDFIKNNVGLKGWRIEELRPEFRDQLKQRIDYSLSLIKTQSQANMLKLENRFRNWINLKTLGTGDKTTLKQAIGFEKEHKKNKKHLKFILRDQTMKLVGSYDEIVANHYDAICFIWKTRRDNRVSGNPSGKYPKADPNSKTHGNHYIRQGKYYFYENSWAIKQGLINKSKIELVSSLKDGMPGKPIGCRCYATNLYELDDIPKSLLSKKGLEYVNIQ